MTRKSTTPAPSKTAPKKAAGAAARKPATKTPAHPLKLNGKEWDRDKVMAVVCNAIASSSKGITTILAAGHEGYMLPDYFTISKWMDEKDENGATPIGEMYARAKEAQAEFMAEELAELHNKSWIPVLDPDTGLPIMVDGKPLMTVDKASVAAVRLVADNKKWLMGKLKPRRFGDKVTQEHVGAGGGAIQARIAVEFVRPPARGEDDES